MLTSNNFTRGMNQDIHPKFQPDGSYRTALNALLESKEGNLLAISNEIGNIQLADGYPEDKKIIGHRLLDDGTTVLFLFDPTGDRRDHEIGIYNPQTESYSTYKTGHCLNFSDDHYVNAIYRLKNGCERIVYFTDNYNPYRVINLDRPEYYGIGTGLDSCDKLKYSRDYLLPSFSAIVNNNNGNLLVGTYEIFYRLLDVDKNATNWIFGSDPIPIADENEILKNSATTVNSYDGGISNEGEVGYVTPTTKSITLTISDVDTRFNFVQLAVVKRTTSSGAISGVDILTPVAILDQVAATTTLDVIYTGANSQVETQTSLEELLSSKVFLDKVYTHEQKDGRLFVANLVTENKSYLGFQRHASAIKTEWIEEDIDITSANSKDAEYYFGDGSFMHDEIYSLGIVYIWSDGTESPVFHIPGRPMLDNTDNIWGDNPFFSGNEDQWDSFDVTGDVNVFNPDKTSRWQVYNTFIDAGYPSHLGLMGYYQVSAEYPEITVCDDDSELGYWGIDWRGELISPGDPIRHHRMPPQGRDNLEEGTYTRRLGIRFTMTEEYPNADISGHYYVFGDRTYDKTIVDKGIIVPISGDKHNKDADLSEILGYDNYAYTVANEAPHLPSSTLDVLGEDVRLHDPLYGYISATTLFKEELPTANYLTVEKIYYDPAINDLDSVGGLPTPSGEIIFADRTSIIQHDKWQLPEELNFLIEDAQLLLKSSGEDGQVSSPNSVDVSDNTAGFGIVENLSNSTTLGVLVLEREFPEIEDYSVTDVSWFWKFNNFFADGNGIAVSLKVDSDVFSNLFSIQYRRIGSVLDNKDPGDPLVTNVYGGDIFLSPLSVIDYHWWLDGTDPTTRVDYATTFNEHSFNTGLRHGDRTETGKYLYFQWKNDNSAISPFQYTLKKYYEPTEETFSFYPEAYLYNESYSALNSLIRYTPLSADYDFCNDCLQRYPYRIMYSQADDSERRKDAYLTILPNNYKDIDGNSGPITDMFINFNDLYVNTPYALYKLPTNAQILTTTDNVNVYLGTGGVLAQPFIAMKNTDTATGGSTYWKSRVSTDFGTVYVDNISGRVFLLGQILADISANGMRTFWRDNGTIQFLSQFKKITGEDYPKSCLSSAAGVGFTSSYDPMHKRIIIHKRDYLLSPEFENKFVYASYAEPPSDWIWFDGNKFYLQQSTGLVEIFTDNPLYFINKSFTISYSLVTNSWVSFHSYLPYYTFNDANYFYSNDIYRHGVGNYQEFYGTRYDHMIDLIAKNNPYETKLTTSIQYSSNVWDRDTPIPNVTFDRVIAYNSQQSTGLSTILPQTTYFADENSGVQLARSIDNKWRLNNLRNYVSSSGSPIWSSEWTDIFSFPYSWIDKVPVNIDFSKNLFELDRLRDYYLGLRLFFNPNTNVRITTDLINTVYANRNR